MDKKFIYVADTGNDMIRKIDLSKLETTTLAGTGEEGDKDGAAAEAQFNNPGAMAPTAPRFTSWTRTTTDPQNQPQRQREQAHARQWAYRFRMHAEQGRQDALFLRYHGELGQQVDTSNGNVTRLSAATVNRAVAR